jgi:RNA polymerase sigma-70 factor (ECF subfamily)
MITHHDASSTSRKLEPSGCGGAEPAPHGELLLQDGDLLRLVEQGNVAEALHHLVQRYGAEVYGLCRRLLRDKDLAEDVQQQVFIEVFRDLRGFRRRSSLRTWLFAIAHHRIQDAAKSRYRAHARISPIDLDTAPDPRPSVAESADAMELQHALDASLGALGAPLRQLLLLRYHRGLSYEEMAELCGGTPGALHRRVTRALPRLRAEIEARIGGTPASSCSASVVSCENPPNSATPALAPSGRRPRPSGHRSGGRPTRRRDAPTPQMSPVALVRQAAARGSAYAAGE